MSSTCWLKQLPLHILYCFITNLASRSVDWSNVGGVTVELIGIGDVAKYVPDQDNLIRWSPNNYKPLCSKSVCMLSDTMMGGRGISNIYEEKRVAIHSQSEAHYWSAKPAQ